MCSGIVLLYIGTWNMYPCNEPWKGNVFLTYPAHHWEGGQFIDLLSDGLLLMDNDDGKGLWKWFIRVETFHLQ